MPFTGIGTWEMLLIAMIVLIVFGPRRLPEISRSMGKALREFKQQSGFGAALIIPEPRSDNRDRGSKVGIHRAPPS